MSARSGRSTEALTDRKRAALAFVEELASLYAQLWFDGRLDDIRKEPEHDPFDEDA